MSDIDQPPSRTRKLGLKPGSAVVLIGLDDPEFRAELDALQVEQLPEEGIPAADAIFLLLEHPGRLAELRALRERIRPAAAVWTLRRRGRPGITEAEVMEAGKRAGLVDVKVVRFSDQLTAEKFVIPLAARPQRR